MRIILSGGGTMGPVTPLLAVAEELGTRDSGPGTREINELLWIGTHKGPEREYVERAGIRFRTILSGKLRRYWSWWNIIDPLFILAGFIQSLILILRWRPDAIVSAGGYVSVPLVWAGWILGIPSVIHQQDVLPLLAVRLMAPFARTITVAFPETAKRFHGLDHGTGGRVEIIGNPVRRFVEVVRANRERLRVEGLRHFGLSADRLVVLVFGGGTGSKTLNDFIGATAAELLAAAQVIHVTGKGKLGIGKQAGLYETEFLKDDLPLAYAVADLVVSRAGIGSIAELSAVGLPTILVPIPNSHQEANADYVHKRDAAVVVREDGRFHQALLSDIKNLLNDPGRRSELCNKIHALLPSSSCARFADIILRVARGEKKK